MLLLITIRSVGQNTESSIRELYNNMLTRVKDMRAGEYPASLVDLTLKRNLSGSGPQAVKQTICFVDDYDYETSTQTLQTQFVTLSYNYAARQYYEEYLYDEDENLVFAYCRHSKDDMSGMFEVRIYLDKNEVFTLLVKEKKEGEKQYTQTYKGSKITPEYTDIVNSLKATGKENTELLKNIYKTLK